MRLMRRLESWWWNRSKPEFDEPDVTTPTVIAEWIAKSKHPPACKGGCQCKPEGGG